jgi:two-component system cell cycle response regulator DivK
LEETLYAERLIKVLEGETMNKKVLIVEDNELNLKLFRDLLEAHDLSVMETRNGSEAAMLAERYQPNLIIMDIQLPEISGVDLIRQMKGNPKTAGIPIIAVTAFAMRDDEDRIMASGCQAYVSKPIAIDSFIQTIQKYVGAVPMSNEEE